MEMALVGGERLRRGERLAAIALRLAEEPGRLLTLTQLAEDYGCAKSTLSEDLAALKAALLREGAGVLETVPGAAGGVRYRPYASREKSAALVSWLCETLSEPSRVMTGGFVYTADLFSDPGVVGKLGAILAQEAGGDADVVVTVESKGLPIGLMTARALGLPLVVASKEARPTEGSVVTLNYRGASGLLRSMSLPRRALTPGKRALIVDDIVMGGGTARALCDMMDEFACSIVGIAALIGSRSAQMRKGLELRALMILGGVDEENRRIELRPASWFGRDDRLDSECPIP